MRKMSKYLPWLIAAALTIVILMLPISIMDNNTSDSGKKSNEVASTPQPIVMPSDAAAAAAAVNHSDEEGEEPADRYLIRDYDGELAVFTADDQQVPDMLTGIKTATLRNNDRAAVSEGIWVNSLTEVASLLEDLGS